VVGFLFHKFQVFKYVNAFPGPPTFLPSPSSLVCLLYLSTPSGFFFFFVAYLQQFVLLYNHFCLSDPSSIAMASETGESTSSFNMLTPTISVSEIPGHANATEQPPDDETLPRLSDDLSRGRHLWQRAVQEPFDPPRQSGMNPSWLSIPHQETVPDDTGV
jgi:hypothetical protein